jgi:hypothetical protein
VTDAQREAAAAIGLSLGSIGAYGWWIRPSPNFSWIELTASDTATAQGIDNTPGVTEKIGLIGLTWQVLEPLRSQFGPIRVTSGYRTAELQNAINPASSKSSHIDGKAADIYSDATHEEMAAYLYQNRDQYPTLDQVIVEYHTGHLHIGIGPNTASSTARGQFLYTLDGVSYFDWEPT